LSCCSAVSESDVGDQLVLLSSLAQLHRISTACCPMSIGFHMQMTPSPKHIPVKCRVVCVCAWSHPEIVCGGIPNTSGSSCLNSNDRRINARRGVHGQSSRIGIWDQLWQVANTDTNIRQHHFQVYIQVMRLGCCIQGLKYCYLLMRRL